jgi:phage shock protein PspC (stress-responsive transcriptional regulator)
VDPRAVGASASVLLDVADRPRRAQENRGEAPQAALDALTYFGSALSGVIAGLSVAAGGLALLGQPLLGLPPARVQLFLVVGPLLGLLPMSLLAYASARFLDVSRRALPAFGIWLACGVLATVWFGLRPLLSS